jgi:hypothetical protein
MKRAWPSLGKSVNLLGRQRRATENRIQDSRFRGRGLNRNLPDGYVRSRFVSRSESLVKVISNVYLAHILET